MSLVRVQSVWTGVAGSPYYTNLYALGPLSTNNGNDLADAWHALVAAFAGSFRDDLTMRISDELLEFSEQTGAVTGAGSTTQTPITGTASTDPLPPANQGLIQWGTAGIVHNRRVRGRTFFPGMMEALSTEGVPTAAFISTLEGLVDAFLATMTDRLMIWAQPFEGSEGNPARAGSAHVVTSASVAPYWAILRSRRD